MQKFPHVNPFARYDLDAFTSPRELTEQLRERIEDAATEEERDTLRAAWELLTKKPTERIYLALEAGPDARPAAIVAKRPRARSTLQQGLETLPCAFLAPLVAPPHTRLTAFSDAALSAALSSPSSEPSS